MKGSKGRKEENHTSKHLKTPLGATAGGTGKAAVSSFRWEGRRLPGWVCTEGESEWEREVLKALTASQ